MAKVSAYKRPATMVEALELLERPMAVIVGGGTKVNAGSTDDPIEVVDLQGLHLDHVERLDGDHLLIGATATLQQLADSTEVPQTIREAARHEMPSTLRSQATVGGTVMTRDRESELLAALLVHGATVRVASREGSGELVLMSLLASPSLIGRVILTGIQIETSGISAMARTGRTRADRAIVAAVARRSPDGRRWLALSGVARTPTLVTSVDELNPPGDFRGSADYRRALAAVLANRALEAVA